MFADRSVNRTGDAAKRVSGVKKTSRANARAVDPPKWTFKRAERLRVSAILLPDPLTI